jgi:hypothetical protein
MTTEPAYQIELTKDEADTLSLIWCSIAGDEKESRRKFINAIHAKLRRAGHILYFPAYKDCIDKDHNTILFLEGMGSIDGGRSYVNQKDGGGI